MSHEKMFFDDNGEELTNLVARKKIVTYFIIMLGILGYNSQILHLK